MEEEEENGGRGSSSSLSRICTEQLHEMKINGCEREIEIESVGWGSGFWVLGPCSDRGANTEFVDYFLFIRTESGAASAFEGVL